MNYEDAGGFSVWEQDKEAGETPLHVAPRHGQEEITRLLIKNGAALEAKSERELTPLYGACVGGHESVVKLLLQSGARVQFDEGRGLFSAELWRRSLS